MIGDWEAVAAQGTDPVTLARTVALSTDAVGRRALAAAADDHSLLAGLDDRTLPAPTSAQSAAAARAAAVWSRLGVRVVLRGDRAWPGRLERVAAPPPWLAVRGTGDLPTGPAVAVVGSRRATSYGTGVAAWLAEAAAAAGAVVVSGGAVGIDAAAHDAAGGRTTVVLGCGHDVAYPRPHARRGGLFDRVLEGGGVVCSEQLPGTSPRPHNVRARNRIVAGLVDVVVVVEGGATSGSLVTASEAADAGVEVLAVPGDVRAPGSAAPHRLLQEGAGVCAGPDDLLAALGAAAPAGEGPAPDLSVLPSAMAAVLAEAWPRAVGVDELAARAGTGPGAVLAAVTRGRVAGVVVDSAEGVRLARSPTVGHG